MLTVTQLARECHVSRTTVLYYERAGLLSPAHRSDNGYRWYGDKQITRLKNILSYRSFGLPIQEIGLLLDKQSEQVQEQTLREQFDALEREITALRHQQRAILTALEEPNLLETNSMNKAQWVEIMKHSGFDEQDMANWHRQFEKNAA